MCDHLGLGGRPYEFYRPSCSSDWKSRILRLPQVIQYRGRTSAPPPISLSEEAIRLLSDTDRQIYPAPALQDRRPVAVIGTGGFGQTLIKAYKTGGAGGAESAYRVEKIFVVPY